MGESYWVLTSIIEEVLKLWSLGAGAAVLLPTV